MYELRFIQWGAICQAFFATFVEAYECCQEFIADGGTNCAIEKNDEVLYEFFNGYENFSDGLSNSDWDRIVEFSDKEILAIW